MIEDALLVKLLVMEADESEQTRLSKTTQALRAIVKLHKRQEITMPDGSWGSNCSECDNNWGSCKTIQAIEKELK